MLNAGNRGEVGRRTFFLTLSSTDKVSGPRGNNVKAWSGLIITMKKQEKLHQGIQLASNFDELIDYMPEAVLIMLRDRIVYRLSAVQHQQTKQCMADFCPGDSVRIQTAWGEIITGIVIRLNQKTVTVRTKNGNRWNVAPQWLTQVKSTAPREAPENRHRMLTI
ncbi:MAG: hypothetical protein QRY16_19635 [Enterobacterales bacterium endosymbiont of Blomia tropicalis]|jgi:hypothetical protein|uniref:hypothetical protein n=1 Tax=Mixta mediterraneensis TaxID=2758443 RepID=UPI0025A799BD|nr:hypothetical protein [Mixta mediterraneensis]MDL4915899.1 hypothetical protein [Mixta mediterraneensis]